MYVPKLPGIPHLNQMGDITDTKVRTKDVIIAKSASLNLLLSLSNGIKISILKKKNLMNVTLCTLLGCKHFQNSMICLLRTVS